MIGVRGEFPGTYRDGSKWGLKVWLDGQLHYFGGWDDRAEASAYGRLVESRYPDRLRRQRGTVAKAKQKWLLISPRPERRRIGLFETRWAAEAERRKLFG